MTYYAVCDANGPISVMLDAEDEAGAVADFEALDHQAAIDNASTDAEDALDVCGDGMSEDDFEAALESAGARRVRSLDEVVNAHAGTTAHLAGGWTLWRTED